MNNDFAQMDMKLLLETYMTEAKEFSEAFSRGASWETLREKRMYIRMLSECINRRYNETHYSERRRDMPPHGD